MIRRRARMTLALATVAALVGLAPVAARAGAPTDTLSDGTRAERWTLKNGLQVTVRNIPGCTGVAVVTAYRVGQNQDPPGHSGMADLLGEVQFTAATDGAPERSRAEMEGLRPLGWNTQVTPRFTLLSEIASAAQFPGALRQVADRMRGVTVTDSTLDRARRTVMRDQGRSYADPRELSLSAELRELAQGVDDQVVLDRLAGRTLGDLEPQDVRERLHRLYVPANAVLALAGDLSGVDVHALVGQLFEPIPGGVASPEPAEPPLKAVSRAVRRPDLRRPLGAVGIIAPAITDSLHPDFYLNALLIGKYCEQQWGPAPEPLATRFRYPLLADARLAQFFPPADPGETDPDQLGVAMQQAIEKLAVSIVDKETFDEQRINNQWIFGGPMTPSLMKRIRVHAGTLHTLASTMAVRALWGDEGFWARYLKRFMNPHITTGDKWADYFQSPDHIVRLLLTPARR